MSPSLYFSYYLLYFSSISPLYVFSTIVHCSLCSYITPPILHLTPYQVNPLNHPPPPHPQNHPFHHLITHLQADLCIHPPFPLPLPHGPTCTCLSMQQPPNHTR